MCIPPYIPQQDTLTIAWDLPRWTAQTEPLPLARAPTCPLSEVMLRCRLCHYLAPRALTTARRIVTCVHFIGNTLYANDVSTNIHSAEKLNIANRRFSSVLFSPADHYPAL